MVFSGLDSLLISDVRLFLWVCTTPTSLVAVLYFVNLPWYGSVNTTYLPLAIGPFSRLTTRSYGDFRDKVGPLVRFGIALFEDKKFVFDTGGLVLVLYAVAT